MKKENRKIGEEWHTYSYENNKKIRIKCKKILCPLCAAERPLETYPETNCSECEGKKFIIEEKT